MLTHACKANTRDPEAGGLGIKACLSYAVRLHLGKTKQTNTGFVWFVCDSNALRVGGQVHQEFMASLGYLGFQD